MKPLIVVKNLSFTYNVGKSNEFQALINASFEIYPEEFIILYGPSGCGKSTLLNVLAGLETPTPDTVWVNDVDLSKMNWRQHANYHRKIIGMIFQAYNLISSLTVLDNVALPQIFMSKHKSKREVIALEHLERFGIKKQAKKLPSELSGGQQQRIGIARSIINDPEIILADEPVGNLDSISAKNVLEILKDLNEKEKKTVIMVTHNPENLEYADRVFHLKDGVIIKETVNHEKHLKIKNTGTVNAPTKELSEIMRAYSGLGPDQINMLIMPYKAKTFAHHFITSRNLDETKIFEDIMHRRLMGTANAEEFFEALNRPSDEGGVGFDIRTATKITKNVNRVLRVSKYLNQERKLSKNADGLHEKISDKEKARNICKFLIFSCFHDYGQNIDEVHLSRFERFIEDRISGKITRLDLYNNLDKPFADSGLGLNSKTARTVTETMELIMILSFGMSQKKPSQNTDGVVKFEPLPEDVKPIANQDNINSPSEPKAPEEYQSQVENLSEKLSQVKLSQEENLEQTLEEELAAAINREAEKQVEETTFSTKENNQ